MEINTSTTADAEHMYDYVNGFFLNPSAFVIVASVLIAYFFVFNYLGDNSQNNNQGYSINQNDTTNSNNMNGYSILIMVVVVIFCALLLINGLQFFFGVDIIASVKHLFLGNPVVDITLKKIEKDLKDITNNNNDDDNGYDSNIDDGNGGNLLNNNLMGNKSIPEIYSIKQVYNIPDNKYNYGDAQAICAAFGSRLANYQEVEDAYNDGGEWCNYGWSDGQMALFPTQKKTYNNLQKIKGHEHDCGRPGVNGGYMANPNLKFGVNCYGYKPKINKAEEDLLQVASPYPKTENDILLEKRVDYWKNRLDDILVSPFNHESWSKI